MLLLTNASMGIVVVIEPLRLIRCRYACRSMKTLKDLRLECGWTQLEVALAADIGYSTYSRLERVGTASSPIIQKLSVFFKLDRQAIVRSLRGTRSVVVSKELANTKRARKAKAKK